MTIIATISAIVVVSIDDHRAILRDHRGDQARSPRRSARSIATSGPDGRDDRRLWVV
jgi:heme exporter protein D